MGGSGLIRRIPSARSWKRRTQDPNVSNSMGDDNLVVQEDEDGFLWIGTTTGLARFDSKRQRFEAPEGAGGVYESTCSGHVRCSGGRPLDLVSKGAHERGRCNAHHFTRPAGTRAVAQATDAR